MHARQVSSSQIRSQLEACVRDRRTPRRQARTGLINAQHGDRTPKDNPRGGRRCRANALDGRVPRMPARISRVFLGDRHFFLPYKPRATSAGLVVLGMSLRAHETRRPARSRRSFHQPKSEQPAASCHGRVRFPCAVGSTHARADRMFEVPPRPVRPPAPCWKSWATRSMPVRSGAGRFPRNASIQRDANDCGFAFGFASV